MAGIDVADAACNHDGLVITAHRAVDPGLESAEITVEVRAAELVVEGGGADRAVQHDLQRGRNPRGLAFGDLPRLLEPGDAKVRHGKSAKARLGFGAASRGAFVANLAAGAGSRPRIRRYRRGVIVRLALHQRMRELIFEPVSATFTRRKARDAAAFHHRGIVRVRHNGALRMQSMRVANHPEQGLVARHAVDNP